MRPAWRGSRRSHPQPLRILLQRLPRQRPERAPLRPVLPQLWRQALRGYRAECEYGRHRADRSYGRTRLARRAHAISTNHATHELGPNGSSSSATAASLRFGPADVRLFDALANHDAPAACGRGRERERAGSNILRNAAFSPCRVLKYSTLICSSSSVPPPRLTLSAPGEPCYGPVRRIPSASPAGQTGRLRIPRLALAKSSTSIPASASAFYPPSA